MYSTDLDTREVLAVRVLYKRSAWDAMLSSLSIKFFTLKITHDDQDHGMVYRWKRLGLNYGQVKRERRNGLDWFLKVEEKIRKS
ncbi:MAG: hypothetical protein QXX95_00795 [Nitrososphaerales archaeon]